MKKKFIIIVALLLILSCLIAFGACKKVTEQQPEERQGLQKNVSTYHDAAYVGANEDFGVTLFTGECEKLIVVDGKVGELTPFATLTVTPLASSLFNNTYTYVLVGANGERTGDLVKDVIGATFSAELTNVKELGAVTAVKVVAQGILDSEITLTNKLDGAPNWKDILKISEEAFAEEIKAETDTGNLEREIYIKLVNAMADEDAPYYYYVSFIKSPADYWALLIDPETGAVISKKV